MTPTHPTPLLALVLLVACGRTQPPEASDEPPPRGSVIVDGITYNAQTRVLESFPVTLQPEATLTNTGGEPRSVTFPDGCVVLLRVYRDPARSGTPAWDQSRVAICTMMITTVELAPGESRSYRTNVSAAEILGDSLPAARYYFTALLRPDGESVEVPAGQAELAR